MKKQIVMTIILVVVIVLIFLYEEHAHTSAASSAQQFPAMNFSGTVLTPQAQPTTPQTPATPSPTPTPTPTPAPTPASPSPTKSTQYIMSRPVPEGQHIGAKETHADVAMGVNLGAGLAAAATAGVVAGTIGGPIGMAVGAAIAVAATVAIHYVGPVVTKSVEQYPKVNATKTAAVDVGLTIVGGPLGLAVGLLDPSIYKQINSIEHIVGLGPPSAHPFDLAEWHAISQPISKRLPTQKSVGKNAPKAEQDLVAAMNKQIADIQEFGIQNGNPNQLPHHLAEPAPGVYTESNQAWNYEISHDTAYLKNHLGTLYALEEQASKYNYPGLKSDLAGTEYLYQYF